MAVFENRFLQERGDVCEWRCSGPCSLVNAQLSTPGEQSEGRGWAFGLSFFFFFLSVCLSECCHLLPKPVALILLKYPGQ